MTTSLFLNYEMSKKFLKFKNCRLSRFSRPYVPGRKILGMFGNNTRLDVRIVEFKKNCEYNGTREDGINILFGFSLGRGDKVFLGWKCVRSIEIYYAYVINGGYTERYLTDVKPEEAYLMSLSLNWEEGSFRVVVDSILDCDKGEHRRIAKVFTGGMGSDLFLFKKVCVSKGLKPEIGEIKVNPEGIMEIRIDESF